MRRTNECDIECFKTARAFKEHWDGVLVDVAMRDILAGKFDSESVRDVMERRAGTPEDYSAVKAALDTAAKASVSA